MAGFIIWLWLRCYGDAEQDTIPNCQNNLESIKKKMVLDLNIEDGVNNMQRHKGRKVLHN